MMSAKRTDNAEGKLERENIYRGGQLLATNESLSAGAPSGLAATPSSSNVALSWTAASGASKYRVERKGAGSSYVLLTTTTSTSTTDSGASTGSAYLYRVCAADGSGNCTSDYSNIALGARLNFTTDATITSMADDPTGATVTSAKAAHITELRTAINAVRSLADESAGSWTHSGLATGDAIYADDVRDLRSKLNEALGALSIQTSNYTDNTIVSYADDPLHATAVKAVHIRELRTRSTSGAGNNTSGGSSGGLHYVLSDLQGTTRAVMNNSGSSSAIIARHDYLPFGEEIGAGLGLRTAGQAYDATDANRQKYGLTERDDATGLDHTWWRKLESSSGRWTSPDPYNGSMAIANPQSFNRYTHVQNDPVNFVDPSGLEWITHRYCSQVQGGSWLCYTEDEWVNSNDVWITSLSPLGGGGPGDGPGGGGPGGLGGNPLMPRPTSNPTAKKQSQQNKDCFERKRREIDAARENFRAGVGKRLLLSATFGGVRGAVAGGIAGAAGGGLLFGVGAVPGAALGATVGGILGVAGGVISGGLIQEPVRRFIYNNFDYNGALLQAKKYCDAEYPY